jgi:DNA-binding NarL/FixJ family response regulator
MDWSAHAATSMNGRIKELKRAKSPLTVAIVDDDFAVRLGVERIIRHWPNLRLAVAFGNGTQALEKLPPLRPNLVLVDLLMPVMNGLECARRLKQKCKDCRIIILAPIAHPAVLSLSMELGSDGLLAKPIATQHLIDAIKAVASSRCVFYRENMPATVRLTDWDGTAPGTLPALVRAALKPQKEKADQERLHDEVDRAARYRVADLAGLCTTGVRSLERHFLEFFGQSPHNWLAQRRKQEALRLRQLTIPLPYLAESLGYQSLQCLLPVFERLFEVTPAQYAQLTDSKSNGSEPQRLPPI